MSPNVPNVSYFGVSLVWCMNIGIIWFGYYFLYYFLDIFIFGPFLHHLAHYFTIKQFYLTPTTFFPFRLFGHTKALRCSMV